MAKNTLNRVGQIFRRVLTVIRVVERDVEVIGIAISLIYPLERRTEDFKDRE